MSLQKWPLLADLFMWECVTFFNVTFLLDLRPIRWIMCQMKTKKKNYLLYDCTWCLCSEQWQVKLYQVHLQRCCHLWKTLKIWKRVQLNILPEFCVRIEVSPMIPPKCISFSLSVKAFYQKYCKISEFCRKEGNW